MLNNIKERLEIKMKKITALLLVLMMIFTFAGCGSNGDDSPYSQVSDWSKYVTIGDYSEISVSYPEKTVTDDEIDTEIATRLSRAEGATKDVFEGKVGMGDQIKISFKGTLEDGTTEPGMNSDSFQMTLGQTSMIEGFTEGIVGHEVGDTFTENLHFPDPYEMNQELSGKGVTFEITILSKQVKVAAELNEEFISADTEEKCKTEEEYRAFIKEYLETEGYDSKVEDAKTQLYYDIMHGCEVVEYYEPAVTYEKNYVVAKYEQLAEQAAQSLEEYVQENFKMTEQEFYDSIDEYVQSMVGEKEIIYALCASKNIKFTEKEYKQAIKDVLDSLGVEDEDAFQKQYGITMDEYAEMYSLRINKMLDKYLDVVFAELAK